MFLAARSTRARHPVSVSVHATLCHGTPESRASRARAGLRTDPHMQTKQSDSQSTDINKDSQNRPVAYPVVGSPLFANDGVTPAMQRSVVELAIDVAFRVHVVEDYRVTRDGRHLEGR